MNSPIAYMPLGYGSLYNHSNEPNVKVEINWVEQTASFKAIKTILVGEELLIQYGK
jgi:SET domain-containing protein